MKHEEDNLQISCVEWFRLQYPKKIVLAIPNGGRRNMIEAVRLKKMGVLAGVSDLFIPEPSSKFHGLWIELKSKTGRLTDYQETFISAMEDRGYQAKVIRDFSSFCQLVINYFKNY